MPARRYCWTKSTAGEPAKEQNTAAAPEVPICARYGWKFLVGGTLIIGAILYLIINSTLLGAQYFITIEDLLSDSAYVGKTVRISGAVIGGVAGSAVGEGRGQALMTIGGIILGSILGRNAENAASTRNALQVILKTDEGRTISVVQPLGVNLRPGELVWLTRYNTRDGGRYRIEPRTSAPPATTAPAPPPPRAA